MKMKRVKQLIGPIMGRAREYREEGTRGPHAVESTADSPEPFGPFRMLSGEARGGDDDEPESEGDSSRMSPPDDFAGKLEFFFEVMPNLSRTMMGIYRSAQTMGRNPADPRRTIEAEELAEIEAKTRRWGADLIGYTRLDPDYVFAGRRVLDKNVIMLAMEMDAADMAKAPHFKTYAEVQHIYADLGVVAYRVAKLLRRYGFAAEAGPALGGDSVYPPLAQHAGLGWVGRNGLLLTEEFGPRVRLAAVYCSIDNLPFYDPADTKLDWLRGFCDMCGACVRRCPPEALLEEAKVRPNGALTYVDNDACFPFFSANHGCGVCIKVCPFSHVDLDKLRRAYDHHGRSEADAEAFASLTRAPELVKLRKR